MPSCGAPGKGQKVKEAGSSVVRYTVLYSVDYNGQNCTVLCRVVECRVVECRVGPASARERESGREGSLPSLVGTGPTSVWCVVCGV